MSMKFEINIGNYRWKMSSILKKIVDVEGTYSLCSDGKHVVYLDYDMLDSEALRIEVKNLQRQYRLGTFYIFESSTGNHHAICLDKVTPEVYELIISSSNCDPSFKKYNRFNRMASRVLRMSPKADKNVNYLYKLDNRSDRIKSLPHADFLEKVYGIEKDSGGYDNSSKLYVCRYQTPI